MRFKTLSTSLALSLAIAALPADAKVPENNRSVDSVHQPVVSHARYEFDLRLDSSGRVPGYERERLAGWLNSIEIGYGDHVSASGASNAELGTSVGSVLAGYGLLLQNDPTTAQMPAPPGIVRVSVRRATASVFDCPDWRTKQEVISGGGMSSNYGCGVNSNLAAMVANPEHLVRGQASESDLRTATSTRAIQTYQEKKPTGAGDLKPLSAGGN